MNIRPNRQLALACALLFAVGSARADDAQPLEELRTTVIGLLDALVQKGVITREQAQTMVADAQAKASAAAQQRAQQEAGEKDAVRVTYVPETVRAKIREEMRAEVTEDVTANVLAKAREERWGVPGALDEWIRNVRIYGDVRARSEGDLYASDNAPNVYFDFNAVNDAGGAGRAAENAFLNTSEDRNRAVGRMRVGALVNLGNAFKADLRLASGNVRSPVSTNQTMGTYGGRWTVNVDKAAILWNPIFSHASQELDFRFGRFGNPFVSTSELIWDADLTFEGVAATYALDLFGRDDTRMERGLFLTVGAFPLQEVELSSDDKWLYGAQLGSLISFGDESSLRIAAGYFKYDNTVGVRNAFDSRQFDFTAPRFLQKGNTLFDIRNDSDPATNLYALVGEYELANASVLLDLGFGATHVMLGGEYVENMGWDQDKVLARTGDLIDERTKGYDISLLVGRPTLSERWHWRAGLSYRYIERDAVLDAFTDSDFHLGGTDAKGYQALFDLGLSHGTWLRLRYLTANEIDGPPLGIDVWQLDLNAQF
ncbi:MAG TPA: putative porin, partial [Steroidobacteraceae bacterium]|nr:putative porin [Steroidobacteraceae bacterium]